MTVRISFEKFLGWAAERTLETARPGLSAEDKIRAEPIARYNTMVHGLHVGVALLVVAAVLTIFTKFAAASVLGGIGYSLYSVMKTKIDERFAYNLILDGEDHDPSRIIFRRLGLPANPNWVSDRLVVCDMPDVKPVVKNYVPYDLPPVVPVRRPAVPPVGRPAAPVGGVGLQAAAEALIGAMRGAPRVVDPANPA